MEFFVCTTFVYNLLGHSEKTMRHSEMRDFPIQDFSVAFACALTEKLDGAFDLIAKNGNESLFAVMSNLFPQVSHNSRNRIRTVQYTGMEMTLATLT